jgi:hypothetical protein
MWSWYNSLDRCDRGQARSEEANALGPAAPSLVEGLVNRRYRSARDLWGFDLLHHLSGIHLNGDALDKCIDFVSVDPPAVVFFLFARS